MVQNSAPSAPQMEADNKDVTKKLKEEGNAAFNKGNWDEALSYYTKAMTLVDSDSIDKAILHKNKAAVLLKISNFDAAVKECDAALEITPNDPKALFRRCQALESLERFEEAYRDARKTFSFEPTNKALQPVLKRLHEIVQDKIAKNSQMGNKVQQMFSIVFDINALKDKRETAMSNILVLAKEKAGAETIFNEGFVFKFGSLVRIEKNSDVLMNGIRTVGQLCKDNDERTKGILRELGIPFFLELINTRHEEQINATQYVLQALINTLSGMDLKDDKKPSKEKCDANRKELDSLLSSLVYCCTSRTFTGLGRDAVLELLMRNCDSRVLDWAERLVDVNGIQRLMEVASELKEVPYESAMEITDNTRTTVALCLNRVYDAMYYEQAKERFSAKVDLFIQEKLRGPDMESKIRVAAAITTLLLGPVDIGSSIISTSGVLEMILVMANSGDFLQQKVACEAIIAAANKKDKARGIIAQGTNILKKLYSTGNDNIKVRALVGLCKLSSSGGTDASIKPFSDGSAAKLAEACRRFLINPAKDKDMRKWAVEGLSYLTLDAEVKEKLTEDRNALQAMIELAKTGDMSVVYGVITTLVNLTNSYDKQEVIPEMLELAKYAKHHIPEEHELDDPDFIMKRLEILAKEGVTSALVALSKTESPNSRELIARVFNAICEQQHLRGIVVAQGGAKALIPLALEGTDNGKRRAAQALARIAVTSNPEVAFPGQRSCELVRPLLALLHHECTALENFEALMALCNLACLETSRKRIIKEHGVSKIESYMYEDHEMLKRAAVQAMTNLLLSEEVVKMYEGENDRTKYLVVLCMDEDVETAKAAAGSLAILTSSSKKACEKVFDSSQWLDVIRCLTTHTDDDMKHRGTAICHNLIAASKETAQKVVETDILEVLMVLSKIDLPEYKKINALAVACLEEAEKWNLIAKPDEA